MLSSRPLFRVLPLACTWGCTWAGFGQFRVSACVLCCTPSECHFAASSTEISLFWLCSFWAAGVCDHVDMLFFRATTRWQNTPWHHLQTGLPARQAGAVQDYEEAAAATAAEFLSLHLSCCSVCVLGDASATISGRPRPVRFLLSPKSCLLPAPLRHPLRGAS